MQFIDLKAQYARIEDLVNENIQKVLSHGRYIFGPEITELEEKLAGFCGVKHCAACSSGTDALLMALLAWDIKPGDAVFTTPFTFISTAEMVSLIGATPVFVDIDKKTYNISPEMLEKKIKEVKKEGRLNPKAVIPVDIFGQCADYDEIEKIAENHGLFGEHTGSPLLVLEDAAQSFGALYKGKRAGSFGNCAATSFFPAKPLGCYGDGGAVLTDDDDLYEKLLSIRVHGQGKDKYTNVRIGINGRIDSIQAGVLLAKMTIFEEELDLRNRAAKKYSDKLKDKVSVPFVEEHNVSAWAQYSVLAENENHREEIQSRLKEADIPTAIYYPIPLHLQEAFAYLGGKEGGCPVSEAVSKRIFSIPFHPYLSDEEIDKICSAF